MDRAEFVTSLGFELDAFQERSLDALDAGRSVLVAAPTGSGKTVVAEYAAAKAIAEGGKAFYTTPLKALSNQKFGDLVDRHGRDRVGLLTGDNSINGDAPAVVMTTEVLRNMIYAGSSTLDGLRYVVLDEVHYLQNAYRGPVWEEVIIHLPPTVDLVCLSATVSNAEEFGDWIHTVRGATEVIIEEKRPVTLHNLFMVGDRHLERPLLMPTLVDGRPNPEAEALDRHSVVNRGYRQPRQRSRLFTPRRAEVIDALREREMLPAIYFIFSRNGCDDAVEQCLREGIRLTSPEERREIRAIAEAKLSHLSDDDLRVLDYGSWITALEAGVAAHHAGMVPPFKEAVEACFAEALVKAVFATETLALGINMPARSVVIEKLTKFSGEAHEKLTPGEYTQLTGRAGRRGIDDVGYGIVLWTPFVPFDQVASLASTRSYELRSAFRPTYNMAANLVRRYEPAEAHHLLNLSFAQYRSDSEIVRAERRLEKLKQEIVRLREAAACEEGDIDEYMRLSAEAEQVAKRREVSRTDVERALDRLGPGDVLVVPGMAQGGRYAVITTASRKAGRVLGVVTLGGKRMQLSGRDFPAPPRAVGTIELPRPYLPNNHNFHRQVADRLRRAKIRGNGVDGEDASSAKAKKAIQLAEIVAAHPVGRCPDVRSHVMAARRASQRERELRTTERQIRGRSESLARQFDRVLRILEAWGYIAGDGWSLTPAGENLAAIYHESDLLVAEVLRSELFDGLSPPECAALASTFTYETRGPGPGPAPWFPKGPLRDRWGNLEYIARELNLAEEDAGLPPTRPPDPGFIGLAFAWAKGDDLSRVIQDEDMTGGDFVRNIKQLIDLLRQLGDVAASEDTRRSCRRAADALFRGVVAASSVVTASDGE
ncbi:MAG TPA: DEAD/DEAH box helicase [Acidimicrobiales bacterium]|nr:DEAD/DEAH box helicase [Acidimicrobiales bacterium]